MASKLFQPLTLGTVQLEHRIAMAPLTRYRTGEDHVQLIPMAQEYYTQRASMPGTFIIAEATMISPQFGGKKYMAGLWTEDQIAGWKKITDAVHERGCHIFCQLIALGRTADAEILKEQGGYSLTGPSPIAMEGLPVPEEMTEEQIQQAIADFAQAAKNAIAAGFDGVEVHGANGYLVDQFVQDVSNQRTDKWGGSIENRARFAVEVARGLVEAVGPERVGFRISPFSPFQDMRMADPVPQFTYLAKSLKELKLAYLHVIESRVINHMDREKVEGIEFLLEAWDNISPVLVAGGYTPQNAAPAVDEEYKKYSVVVVFGRHFLANPDLPYRIKNGLPLNKYDRSSFYIPGEPKGYLDYPFFSQETATTPGVATVATVA